ncbi:DUF4352 domain-containing protein [Listeria booriae]|uniref:DUF4352 domain-containing protein n=1 Tax=Listeria booriae TaxID=1552123 RepID=UPI00162A5F9A|nr:DUF4352 domain-containing protein [Listeria booriae]MBC2317198.1 DUF4352 domain-containing protein [Listeria booriae]
MKKAILGMMAATISLSLVGCTASPAKETENKTATTEKTKQNKEAYAKDINQTKTWQDISITIKQLNVSFSEGNQKLEFVTAIENKGEKVFGLGAGEFTLKADNKKTYKISDGDNFGGEVKNGQKMEGSMYFQVPTDVKKGSIEYSPDSKTTLSWDIDFAQK